MFQNFIKRLDPAWTAFVCGILLSLVAIAGSIAPNGDGMLYIETARIYLEGGVDAALALYNWNAISRVFISILIAHVSGLPGVSLEAAGYLLSVLFLAGTCALVVLGTRERFPGPTWAACAVALAIRETCNAVGTADLRLTVVGWTSAVEAAWSVVADSYDLSFDWDFVPGWIIDHIDWSDPAHPAIRPEPVRKDPDRAPTDEPVTAQPPAWRPSADEGN